MLYRVVSTLVIGLTLLFGSVCLSQSQTPIDGSQRDSGALVGPSSSTTQPAGAESQSANAPDSTAVTHWWQRIAPSSSANGPTENSKSDTAAQPASPSSWKIGALFKASDKKLDQTDPFAAKAAAKDQLNTNPKVLALESGDPSKRDLTLPPEADIARSGIRTDAPLAASLPGNAATNNGSLLTGSASTACPYPDTGIQALYPATASTPETAVSDNPTASTSTQSPAKVREAFSGLLGHDDVRTPQEAALPLLAPYKDLPVDYQKNSRFVRSVKAGSSASPDSGTTMAAAPATTAASTIVADTAVYTDNQAVDSKNKSVVGAAFNSLPDDTNSRADSAQAPTSGPGVSDSSSQTATAQPLQLGGVEAHQLTGSPLNRPKIIYHPAGTVVDSAGHKLMRPNVHVSADSAATANPSSVQLAQFAAASEGTLPAPVNIAPEAAYPIDEQQWMPPMSGIDMGQCENCQGGCNGEGGCNGHCDGCGRGCGIGSEYVAQAPFFVETSQPFNNCRVRLDLARDLEFPDRSEYFWAKTPGGRGPGVPVGSPSVGETSVNYQDLDFYIEKGTKRMSIGTDLPIRAVDPEIRDDSSGFADMDVKTKVVLMDGKNWQLTQLFNTYLPTGSVHRGTGDGHVSLEPGVAYRWKWSDDTYFHGDLKYLFPIGADPNFSGQVFNYGIGISHVLVDTDTWALIPTLEMECWTFVDGRQSLPGVAAIASDPNFGSEEVNTIGIMNLCPGLRWVCDKGCDCGTKEFGISAGIAVTSDHLYEEILRLEFRWSR